MDTTGTYRFDPVEPRGRRMGTARLCARGAPCGSGVMVGVIGEQTLSLGDGNHTVVRTNERER